MGKEGLLPPGGRCKKKVSEHFAQQALLFLSSLTYTPQAGLQGRADVKECGNKNYLSDVMARGAQKLFENARPGKANKPRHGG